MLSEAFWVETASHSEISGCSSTAKIHIRIDISFKTKSYTFHDRDITLMLLRQIESHQIGKHPSTISN